MKRELNKCKQLTKAHGALRPAKGLCADVMALVMAVWGSVLLRALRFAEYRRLNFFRRVFLIARVSELAQSGQRVVGGDAPNRLVRQPNLAARRTV